MNSLDPSKIENVWNTCTRCKLKPSTNKLRGYYYTEALCDHCIECDAVKCNKCDKLFGYICRGQLGDLTQTSAIYCLDCIKR